MTSLYVRKASPYGVAAFSPYLLLGVRADDNLDRWVGVVVTWGDGRDVARALDRNETVEIEVPSNSWFYMAGLH